MKVESGGIGRIVDIMIADSGIKSRAKLAERIGTKDVTFRASLTNESIRLVDFVRAADEAGYEVIVRKKGGAD